MWLLVKTSFYILMVQFIVMTPNWHHVKGNLISNTNYTEKQRNYMKQVDNSFGYHIHGYSKAKFTPRNSNQETKEDSLEVDTTKGRVRGVTLTAKTGKTVDAWLGIPFARPPIGKLRFQRPKPVKSWSNLILNSTTLPNSCVQTIDTTFGKFSGATVWNANTEMSEDCLYLNIYVPKPRPKNAAVLVWIYGGGFYSGTATLDIYDPRILVSEENVIVVSINYRVASLGFLFLGVPEAPGNVGLLDQVMAIKFIKSNIKNFGGNPENITLFGESAGAASISFHLLSPLTRNYFSQAILESGTATVPWAMVSKKESIARSKKLAQAVHCPHLAKYNTTKLLECLRKICPKVLVKTEWDIVDSRICKFPFVPTLDAYFIKEDPIRTLRSQEYKKSNILIGTNSEEGIYFIIYHLHKMLPKKEHIKLQKAQLKQAIKTLYPEVKKYVREAIISRYTDRTKLNDSISNINALDKVVGDNFFTCDSEDFAHLYSEGSAVFNYKFKHRSSRHVWPSWAGVMHGDEIIFIFGMPLDPANKFSREEAELSKRMMKYWANFAKTGNPSINEDGSSTAVKWPQYTSRNRAYLQLGVNSSVGYNYRAKYCAFWKKFLPRRHF